jgi:polyhydroxyalkanoate synthesis repressor PhaR
MLEPQIIREHSNRRLWDPLRRGYLVLDDIHDLVIAGIDFSVIDNDRVDVTRSKLLQVIATRERGSDPSMTTEFLLETIRSHAENSSGMTATFLEQALRQFNPLFGNGNSTIARHLAETNYKRWRSVQHRIYKVLANATSPGNSSPRPPGKWVGLPPTQRSGRQSKRSPRPSGLITSRSSQGRRASNS